MVRSSIVQVCGSASLASAQRTRPYRWACLPPSDDVRKNAGKWRLLSGPSVRAATARSVDPLRSPANASRSYGAVNGDGSSSLYLQLRRLPASLPNIFGVIGLSARQLWTVPGNTYVLGFIQRQHSRKVPAVSGRVAHRDPGSARRAECV